MVGRTDPSNSYGGGWVCGCVGVCVRVHERERVWACVCACVRYVFAIYDNNISPRARMHGAPIAYWSDKA